MAEAALAAADRHDSLLRSAAEHDRLAAAKRLTLARARAKLKPVTVSRSGLVVPGGYMAWCRYAVPAAMHEAAAVRKRAEAAAIDRRAGDLGLAVQALGRTHRRVAEVIKTSVAATARVTLIGAIQMAAANNGESKRVADRAQKINDRLTEHENRSGPFDARTRMAVIVQRSRTQKAAKARLLETASRFKGGRRGVAAILAARAEISGGPEFGSALVAPERVATIRAQVEMERNRRTVPQNWDALDVDLWMIGAYETLFRMPMSIRPREFGNAMPQPTNHAGVEWADELARLSLDDEEAVPTFGRARLRALGMPDKVDVDRMNAALEWPVKYLLNDRNVARCVGFGAMWTAIDLPQDMMRDNVDLVLSMSYYEFDTLRGHGLGVIAMGLNENKQSRPVL